MSTYYGYACHTCKQRTDHGLNHGDDQLLELLQNFEAVEKVQKLRIVDFRCYGSWGGIDPFSFLKKHKGHDIEVVSEYDKRSQDYEEEKDDDI